MNIDKSRGGRVPELDGLRGVAIGLILMLHYITLNLKTTPGSILAYALVPTRLAWSGVDLFFVLSGFLIGGILLDASGSSNYFRVFYTRRFLRIVPLYALFIGCVFLLDPYVQRRITGGLIGVPNERVPWYLYMLFLQNIAMAFQLNPVGPITVTWSLGVEEQFYLTLPFLVRFLRLRTLKIVVWAGVVMAPVWRILLFQQLHWPHWWSWYALTPCRADALLLGVLGAMAVRDPPYMDWMRTHRREFRLILGCLVAGVIYLTVRSPAVGSFLMVSVGFTWLASFYLAIVLYVITDSRSWLSRCMRMRWLMWLGNIAYGTYLFHALVMALLGTYVLGWRIPLSKITGFLLPGIALAITLLVCRASWLYFEKPLVQWGHRFRYERDSDVNEAVEALTVHSERT